MSKNESGDIAWTILDTFGRGFFFMPFARTQILLQTQDLIPTFKNSKPLSGFLNGFYRTLKNESIFHIFRGLNPYMLIGLSNMILHHKVISDVKAIQRPSKDGMIGSLFFGPDLLTSAVIMLWNAVFHPLTVLQVRASCHNFGNIEKDFSSISHIYNDILQIEGRRALYRGYVPMTMFMIMQQDAFDPVKLSYQETNSNLAIRILRDLTLYPFIVTSHRMMIATSNTKARFKSALECCRTTYSKFGIRGFYGGFQVYILSYSYHMYKNMSHNYQKPSYTEVI